MSQLLAKLNQVVGTADTSSIGWDVNVGDESKFRVIEYAFM